MAETGSNVIRVRVPSSVFNDMEKMHAVTAKIMGLAGCGSCHSGHDIRFIRETDYSVSHDLQVTAVGGSIGVESLR